MKYLSLFILFIAFLPLKTNASSAAGAEITYVWLKDSTFQISYHFYRDCKGAAEPTTVNLCYSSTCGYSGNLTLEKLISIPPGVPDVVTSPPAGCPGRPNQCISDTSTIPGYQEWWYQNTITLPGKCNSWTFSHSEKRKITTVSNLSAADTMLYVEATLNNLDAPINSSAYFTTRPTYIACNNSPLIVNMDGYDNNGDSLGFECITPLTGSDCSPYSATYTTGNSLPLNPLPCSNTFQFYPQSGQIFLMPNTLGLFFITVKITEYRNIGIIRTVVGSVMRCIAINVFPCSGATPILKLDTSSITGATISNGTIYSCAGTTLNFSYDGKTPTVGDILTINDNHKAFSGPPTVSYVGIHSDSIHGVFSWKPGDRDTGLKIYTVTVADSTCSNGIFIAATYPVPIYIRPSVTITTPVAGVCKNASITLHGVGGSSYTWGVLPGGSPLSSLSCTFCSDPTASPTLTTSYTLSSTSPYGCYDKDTLKIVADTVPAKPTIAMNNYVCSNSKLFFKASHPSSSVNYYWTGPGGIAYGKNPYYAYPPFTTGYYKVWVTDIYNCPSTADSVYINVIQHPKGPKIISDSAFCLSSPLSLTALSLDSAGHNDTMQNFTWMGIGFVTTSSDTLVYENTYKKSTPTVGYYYVFTTSKIYHCNSDTTRVLVSTYAIPSKPVLSSNPPVCPGDSLRLFATDTSSTIMSYHWSGPAGFTSSIQNPVKPSVAGIYEAWVTGINGCNSYPDSAYIATLPWPASPKASHTSPVCEGQLLYLSAGTVVSGVTYHWAVPDTGLYYNVPTPTLIDPKTGIYKVWVTNSYGCNSSADSMYIHVTPIFTPYVSIYATQGSGSSWILLASVINGGTAPRFQWKKNGIDIPGATTNPYIIATWHEGDAYSVKVHSNADCAIPADAVATTDPLSVSTVGSDNALDIYPNPAKADKLFIKLKTPAEVVNVTISDVYGRQLFNTGVRSDGDELLLPVDVSTYRFGVYLVTIRNAQNGHELNATRFVKE